MIGQINEISTIIAGAMEEQTVTTGAVNVLSPSRRLLKMAEELETFVSELKGSGAKREERRGER